MITWSSPTVRHTAFCLTTSEISTSIVKAVEGHDNQYYGRRLYCECHDRVLLFNTPPKKEKTFPNLETLSFPFLCASDITTAAAASTARTPFQFQRCFPPSTFRSLPQHSKTRMFERKKGANY